MPTIYVTDIYGQEHTIDAPAGRKLMEILREYDFGIAASCGGYCSCATCHVYVDPSWVDRLPQIQSDEQDLLSMLTTYDKHTSRLSCQVLFTDALDGIRLTVAPEEERALSVTRDW
jgi:2Fe-2S ferredoxin